MYNVKGMEICLCTEGFLVYTIIYHYVYIIHWKKLDVSSKLIVLRSKLLVDF